MVCSMISTACRMVGLVTFLSVAFVVVLAAMSAPASAHVAHVAHSHDVSAPVQELAGGGDLRHVDTCCHKAGTCIVQFLQFGPANFSSDAAMSLAQRSYSAERYASVAHTADPPPPRL